MEILHGALAYRLSNSATLSREQKQLVRATVSKMDNNITKDQLRKVFTNNAGDLLQKNYLSEEKIKVEASTDVYYAKGNIIGGLTEEREAIEILIKSIKLTKKYKEFLNTETKQNPSNSQAEISRYNYCGFKFDWANNCPDLPEQSNNLQLYNMKILHSLIS